LVLIRFVMPLVQERSKALAMKRERLSVVITLLREPTLMRHPLQQRKRKKLVLGLDGTQVVWFPRLNTCLSKVPVQVLLSPVLRSTRSNALSDSFEKESVVSSLSEDCLSLLCRRGEGWSRSFVSPLSLGKPTAFLHRCHFLCVFIAYTA